MVLSGGDRPMALELLSVMSARGEGIDPLKMADYACDWEKTSLQDALWFPGVGDHGGPTRDMLEVQKRWQQSPFFPSRIQHRSKYLQHISAH